MLRLLAAVAACVVLAGCAGTDTQLRMLENSNALQIEPSQVKDYVVRMKNLVDLGYDPDNPETRKSPRGSRCRHGRAECADGFQT
jgi:hypothetical protein